MTIALGPPLALLGGRRLSYGPLTLSTRLNQGGVGDDEIIDFSSFAEAHMNPTLPFTVGSWFKTGSAGSERNIMCKFDRLAQSGWRFGVDTADKMFMVYHKDATHYIYATEAVANTVDSVWHFGVITFDGSALKTGFTLYVDGAPVAMTQGNLGAVVDFVQAAPLYVGAAAFGGAGVINDWLGYLCHSFIIAEELTPAEVAYISSLGVPMNLPVALPTRTINFWSTLGDGCAIAGAGAYPDISGLGHHGTPYRLDAGDIQGDIPP